VQDNTLGIQKAASTFERAMTGRAMHSIAFLTLCAAYIERGLSKLSSIAVSMAEMEGFHLDPAGLYLAAVITTELGGSAMVISGRGRWVGALWLAGEAVGAFREQGAKVVPLKFDLAYSRQELTGA
jgi:uncharacterized membrane protein YphA (DoxX/SURF4 family)